MFYTTVSLFQVYASLWAATSAVPGIGETLAVGSTYFLSASVTILSFSLSMVAWCRLRGKDVSELGEADNKSSFKRQDDKDVL